MPEIQAALLSREPAVWPRKPAAESESSYIPFNRFCKTGTEFTYIQQAIDEMHVSGNGRFTKLCHALLEEVLGAPKVLLTTSCTDALEMAALLLDVQPGDEVILPSFTFVSTASAFALRGARPVFIDIRPDTLNLDETLLERLITPRTKAILPVHYAGIGCEMDAILEIARRLAVPVVEDNAHGLLGKYKGKNLGTFGCLATQSFHETKNFTCGEGGALVINDAAYCEQAEIIRDKGTNRSRFVRGQVDKYSWVGLGSSYLPSDILAAVLYAQLESREMVQAQRRHIWERYNMRLRDWAGSFGVRLPVVPSHCQQSYHMFYLLLPSEGSRARLIQHLKTRNILSVFHYLPLHLSEMGLRLGGPARACPVTVDVSNRLLRLPFYNGLTESEQARVIRAIHEFEP
jgi:dTDP-4-amino-4,6-dideoxygalactose transaminase